MSPPPMLPQQRISLQLSAADCQLAAEQPALDARAHDSDDDGSQVALLGGTACRSDDTHPGDCGCGSSSDIAAAQAARLHSTSTAGGQQSGPESLLQVHIMRPAALASALAALQQSKAPVQVPPSAAAARTAQHIQSALQRGSLSSLPPGACPVAARTLLS